MRTKSPIALFLTSLLGAADGSGIFIGGGYQQGKAQLRMQDGGQTTEVEAPMKGFGLQLGYQFFMGRFIGIKAYGFFDYAHTSGIQFSRQNTASPDPIKCDFQGGSPFTFATIPGFPAGVPKNIPGIPQVGGGIPSVPTPKFNMPNCQINVMGILQQLVGSNKPVEPNMLTYGGGVDLIFNIINNQAIALGVFGGVQLAGNSWLLATPDFKDLALTYVGLNKKPTAFQYLLNVGGRLRILKHSSIEGGIKFPMLKNNPFLRTKNEGTLYIRRLYSWYINYTFTF
ncbi:outer membrane protein [Helicobacter cynogastricus]|uniref:outer membrane protein n=1 Tax=Helicobacter cynogastricus TaxID=329937 RepID=UPI000CF0A373|nr:outer membrane protein [Helicobacter cynogastricus]